MECVILRWRGSCVRCVSVGGFGLMVLHFGQSFIYMETVVVKENWKAAFKSISFKLLSKTMRKFLLYFGLAVGVFMALLSLGEGNWIMTLCFLFVSPILFYLTMVLCMLLMSPMLVLFKIRTIISPRTYTFSLGHDIFSVQKNDKTMVEVPLEDFNCYSMTSPYGTFLSELMIFYAVNGKAVNKKVNLIDLYDEDKLCVRQFFENLTKQKTDLVRQKTGDVGEENLSPLEETFI